MSSLLFTRLSIRGVELPNRIVVSPMCQYSARDGFANDWHLVNVGSRAVGGAGLVFVEATAVEAIGRITHEDLGIWDDRHVLELERIARFIREQGVVPAIQLAHAGRKASTDVPWRGSKPLREDQGAWVPVAPSAVPFSPAHAVPRALSIDEIAEVVSSFVSATHRARAAGFEVIEIHGAHGYLIHEFLSPLSNTRSDRYGGSFENRSRLAVEIVSAVRGALPDHVPLFLRISATDWAPGGWDLDSAVELARRVKTTGVDLVDCSSGGLVHDAAIPLAPGFQVPFAQRIRRDAGIATGAVGLITDVHQAEEILRSGQADLIFMAREFLRSPYWPVQAARQLGDEPSVPPQYQRAYPKTTP